MGAGQLLIHLFFYRFIFGSTVMFFHKARYVLKPPLFVETYYVSLDPAAFSSESRKTKTVHLLPNKTIQPISSRSYTKPEPEY